MAQKSILLVEDDAPIREIVRDALTPEYHVLEASNFSEAYNYFKTPMDLALIDYILPDCCGFDIVKAIREEKPNLPTILMTAYSHEDIILRALRLGLTDYVKKPLKLKYLKKKLRDIFEGQSIDNNGEIGVAKRRDEFLIEGIEEYIGNNYMRALTLDELARRAGMSRSNFCRKFKQKVGQSFISFINNMRINYASGLLNNPDFSIKEITYSVGYGSVSQFERTFKRLSGITPREYRDQIKQEG